MKRTRLGDILLRKNAITQEQLEQAEKDMKLNGETLTTSLVKHGVFTEDKLVKFISSSFGRPAIELKSIDIDTSLTKISVDIMIKNQAIPAYDPRPIKGMGITYATSTQGADHTMGYTITANILGVGGTVDPLSKVGQIELSRNLQIATAAIDSTGMCLFIAFAALDDESSSIYGMPIIETHRAKTVIVLKRSILALGYGLNLVKLFAFQWGILI